MPSNMALLLAVSFLSIIIRTADSLECFPGEKETEKPVRGYVQVYCKLDDDLQTGESFILEKSEAQIGQCSYKRCRTSHPYNFQLSVQRLKNIQIQIGNLAPENSGAYYGSLNNSSVVLNRLLVLNLTVNQNEPTCDINLRHESLEIELSCEAMLYSSGETTLELTLVDNGTEVHINSHSNKTLSALSSLNYYSASSTVKLMTSLNAFLTGALRPIQCLLGTKKGSHDCNYPMLIDMAIVMTGESELGCRHAMMEVWLVSTNFKTLKLHPSEPTIIDASMADGNSFILICGIETRGSVNLRSITKFKVEEYDICYTANVKKGWLQTTITIIHGCVSTTQIDRLSYGPIIASNSSEPSLTTEITTDDMHYSTENQTSVAQSNTEVQLPSNESTTKSHDYQYLKYATLLSIVASVTILVTITTCLYLVHQRMNVNGERDLRLRYYRYDPHGEGVATDRRNNQAMATTALATSNSIHSLQGCRLNVSQVQHVEVDDDYTGDVSGALANRPALPPRAHVEASTRKTDCHPLPAELNNGGSQQNSSFAVVIPTCQRVTWCPSKGRSKPK